MPSGRNGGTTSDTNQQERPVVYQKYFKSGSRTYASQIKISQNGKKYMVLTEGVRDPETQQVKKHTICVFDQDLKEFFAMLQETVVFLRANKDPGNTVAGIVTTKPTVPVAAKPAARMPVATATAARPATKPVASQPQKSAKLTMKASPTNGARPAAKPAARPVARAGKR